jgi:aryl-alcohol dehydrogenase-like predicted oxidoreductase
MLGSVRPTWQRWHHAPDTRFDAATDFRHKFPRFSPDNIRANLPILNIVRRKAVEKGATPAQLALAWVLAQRPFIVPIPGTRSQTISSKTWAP